MKDQAAIELQRQRDWRKTLPVEVQRNTEIIELIQEGVSVGVGGIGATVRQFIRNRGWEVGFAANGQIYRWPTMRDWIEAYWDNGGLHMTVHDVFPLIAQVQAEPQPIQKEAVEVFLAELDPVDKLPHRKEWLKICEAIGAPDLLDAVHDGTKQKEGGDGSNQHKSNACNVTRVAESTRLDPRTDKGGRQQLRSYAAEPQRCERYGKDHALCQEAWEQLERGDMSITEALVHCGLRKKEPSRKLYVSTDMAKLSKELDAVLPTDRLDQLIALLQERRDARM
jgi:hypothetical protein